MRCGCGGGELPSVVRSGDSICADCRKHERGRAYAFGSRGARAGARTGGQIILLRSSCIHIICRLQLHVHETGAPMPSPLGIGKAKGKPLCIHEPNVQIEANGKGGWGGKTFFNGGMRSGWCRGLKICLKDCGTRKQGPGDLSRLIGNLGARVGRTSKKLG